MWNKEFKICYFPYIHYPLSPLFSTPILISRKIKIGGNHTDYVNEERVKDLSQENIPSPQKSKNPTTSRLK